MRTSRRGITLPEIIVGITFLGIAAGAFIRFASQIQQTLVVLADAGRKEAWRTTADQVVLTGVDPSSAQVFTDARDPIGSLRDRFPANIVAAGGSEIGSRVGEVEVSRLVVQHTGRGEQLRPPGIGLVIGQSTTPPPIRFNPLPPLPPVIHQPPLITPERGVVVPYTEMRLVADGSGNPDGSRLALSARGTDSVRVGISVTSPVGRVVRSINEAIVDMSANELASGLTARAWTEFPGDLALGHIATYMEDGRTRWFIPTEDGRLQPQEPSDFIDYSFRINLGYPVLRWMDTVVDSRDSVRIPVDWWDRIAVVTGAPLKDGSGNPSETPVAREVDWSDDVRSYFNPMPGFGWEVRFASSVLVPSGTYSGSVAFAFTDDNVRLWMPTAQIIARPRLTGLYQSANYTPFLGVESDYTFQIDRVSRQLGTPENTTAPAEFVDGIPTFTPDDTDFARQITRLSFVSASESPPATKPYVLTPRRLGNLQWLTDQDPFGGWRDGFGNAVTVEIGPRN